MKIMISGARSLTDEKTYDRMAEALDAAGATAIIHGGAKGADQLAARYAAERGLPETVIKPDYTKGGKYAPLIRNTELVRLADAVICTYAAGRVRKGGTGDSYKKAKKAGKLLREIMPEGTGEQKTLF